MKGARGILGSDLQGRGEEGPISYLCLGCGSRPREDRGNKGFHSPEAHEGVDASPEERPGRITWSSRGVSWRRMGRWRRRWCELCN